MKERIYMTFDRDALDYLDWLREDVPRSTFLNGLLMRVKEENNDVI